MAEKRRFKVGDLVKLRSGGPVMTVSDVIDSDLVRCQWFAGKKLETGNFDTGTLQSATEEVGGPSK